MAVTELVPGRFDPSAGRWADDPDSSGETTLATLTLATFNVWFDTYAFDLRSGALLSIVEGCDADLIAFQEVTSPFLAQALARNRIRRSYRVSASTMKGYGNVIFSRIPFRRLSLHDFPGQLGRHLLVAEFEINRRKLRVATVHLESYPESTDVRIAQLNQTFPVLEEAPTAIVMGDFNFDAADRENESIDPRYRDLWPALRPGEPGWTEDTGLNRMRLERTGKEKQVRFDRVLLRSTDEAWRPTSIDLLGTAPVSPDRSEVFPSDHFGLTARCTASSSMLP